MNYQETIDYLFNVAPLFQNIGAGAYKEGLENTRLLDEHFGHPHKAYKTIHVAGTNGKGSVSHTLAAILQAAGFRVGLYTSPHLVDFRERIRVNGKMIPEQRVIDFVTDERSFFEPLHPSFFELTTALAFQYFMEQEVDIAVIEVGLGGRLDCTNIITPLVSIITNISFDHTQFLGDTLDKIANEKAGIIKPNVPVIIGETNGNSTIHQVFLNKAQAMDAEIIFADEGDEITNARLENDRWYYETRHFGCFEAELGGLCQKRNTATILAAVQQLTIKPAAIHEGFARVCELTGLMGRWQKLRSNPTVICDTGHNVGGLQYIAKQLTPSDSTIKERKSIIMGESSLTAGHKGALRMVIGMVADKDVRGSLSLFPRQGTYYFTQASVKRAMPAQEIASLGQELGLPCRADLEGNPITYSTVGEAYHAALADARPQDFIFVGGSSFIVADLLKSLQEKA
ncbi:MAG: bifunctional folylpolyglutamate synthase/dihydrofolate synthase [Bacteroidaceae bacterium]|nr:bifunctional folylpolyglutamate synthase/dihydrofolate synthase [Bacteroidaceae bacterium]